MTNVILITIDCLRYDRCGFNGHNRNTTPTLDSLATESVVYDECYSTGPYTTESLPGILAGEHSYNGAKYGEQLGYKAISIESSTLASEFSENNYNTTAVISNPHLTTNRNFNHGFDDFYNFRSEEGNSHDDNSSLNFGSYMYSIREKMRNSRSRYNLIAALYTAYRYGQYQSSWPTTEGEDITDRCLEKLENGIASDDPFFLWTHYMDLHAPINPDRADSTGLFSLPTLRSIFWDASRAGRFYEPGYEILYDAALRYIDDQIGRLVNFLKDKCEINDTVIIVTADHGEALFDREQVYGHPPHYHYDELLHVPLLVFNNDGEPRRIQEPMSLAWMHEVMSAATGVELTGFPSESGSKSILKKGGENLIISDTLDESGHTVSARNSDYKSIMHQGKDNDVIEWEYSNEYTTFMYKQDRGERCSLKKTPVDLLNIAEELLDPNADLSPVEGEFSPATEQRLQDLGYKM